MVAFCEKGTQSIHDILIAVTSPILRPYRGGPCPKDPESHGWDSCLHWRRGDAQLVTPRETGTWIAPEVPAPLLTYPVSRVSKVSMSQPKGTLASGVEDHLLLSNDVAS